MVTLDLNGPTDLHGLLETRAGPLFFVVIANGKLEKNLLDRWLASVQVGVNLDAGNSSCLLSDNEDIGETGERLDEQLAALTDETLVTPIRVLWLPAPEQSRWQPLLGTMHRPGAIRQYLALRSSNDSKTLSRPFAYRRASCCAPGNCGSHPSDLFYRALRADHLC